MIVRKIKPFVAPMIYILAVVLFVCSLYLANRLFKDSVLSKNDDTNYVDDSIINDNSSIPVVASTTEIAKPFINTEVSIYKTYYDYLADTTNQEGSIIYYENTYMQNSGIDYSCANEFDVVSILDGTVTRIVENEILGTTVEIRHSNDMISIYQAVSSVNVKENDAILQGQVIAKSSKSKIYADVSNGLHFELYYQGKVVNPEEYYNKVLEDL